MTNWIPGFSTPLAAALFGLLVPLVIFYFLKLRRPRMELPSLALWRQVINDQRVNSPFQKFRRNLLLLLQVLLLCLIVLAAMQPFTSGDLADSRNLPILIDVSASMKAVDQKTGQTRLDLARDEVRKIIQGLLPGQQISLISVGNSARRLTEFTDNQKVLNQALDALGTVDVPSQLEDGLRLAQALTRTHEINSVRLYSDGNLPMRIDPGTGKAEAVIDFDLPYTLDFHQVKATGSNIGISALSARRSTSADWNLFVRIDGSPSGSTAGHLTLRNHGQIIAEEDINLAPGETQRLIFRVDATTDAKLLLELTPRGFDALETDNMALLMLPAVRDLKVYCPLKLESYRQALSGLKGIIVEPAPDGSTRLSSYDLMITDSIEDASKQAGMVLFVGMVPPDLTELVTIKQETPSEVVDWKRNAPLLQHVQLRDVLFLDSPERNPEVTESSLEAKGYELLVQNRAGPLLMHKREGTTDKFWLLVHTDRSTLPYRVGFPVLVSNLVEATLQQNDLSEITAPRTGSLPEIVLDPDETYQVDTPFGDWIPVKTDSKGILNGVAAVSAGAYTVYQGKKSVRQVGVSLLSPDETRLESVSELRLNEIKVAAETERVKSDKPWWPDLAFLGLLTLMAEWWLFQKPPAALLP